MEKNYLQEELYELVSRDPAIFDFLQESSLDGLWYWDLENPENEWMNKRFWTILGYDPDEMPHKSSAWQNIILTKDLEAAIDNFHRHLENPDYPYDQTVRYRHRNGSTVWIQCRGMAIRKDGKPVRMLGTHHDVTRLKNAELGLIKKNEDYLNLITRLEEAKMKAEESDRLKTSFLGNISHEIRTPLNAIIGFSDLIATNNDDPAKVRQYCEMISSASYRLLSIMTDVLEIAKIKAGQSDMQPGNFSLESFSDIFKQLEESASRKNIRFSLKLSTQHRSATIRSDQNKIRKILVHVADNAVKFTQKGAVDICISLEEDILDIGITDTGVGIQPEIMDLVYEPFRQGETNRQYAGNGLGLTIVRAFTDQLNGKFSIDSKRGEGTTVKIRIPVSVVESSEDLNGGITPVQDNNQTTLPNRKTILVADDEFINYVYIYELLKTGENEVIHAINGQDAVDKCMENEEISLVLMDIRMPVMDGGTAARAIKKFRKGIPIIAQTAYTLEDGFNMDVFVDCLIKPVRKEVLREKIRRYI